METITTDTAADALFSIKQPRFSGVSHISLRAAILKSRGFFIPR